MEYIVYISLASNLLLFVLLLMVAKKAKLKRIQGEAMLAKAELIIAFQDAGLTMVAEQMENIGKQESKGNGDTRPNGSRTIH